MRRTAPALHKNCVSEPEQIPCYQHCPNVGKDCFDGSRGGACAPSFGGFTGSLHLITAIMPASTSRHRAAIWLSGLLLSTASVAAPALPDPAVPDDRPPSDRAGGLTHAPAPSIEGVLDAQGHLLPGTQGSFSGHGFTLTYDAQGGPRFVRGPNAAVGTWSSAFDFRGIGGSISAVAVSGANVYVGGTFANAGGNAGTAPPGRRSGAGLMAASGLSP